MGVLWGAVPVCVRAGDVHMHILRVCMAGSMCCALHHGAGLLPSVQWRAANWTCPSKPVSPEMARGGRGAGGGMGVEKKGKLCLCK